MLFCVRQTAHSCHFTQTILQDASKLTSGSKHPSTNAWAIRQRLDLLRRFSLSALKVGDKIASDASPTGVSSDRCDPDRINPEWLARRAEFRHGRPRPPDCRVGRPHALPY